MRLSAEQQKDYAEKGFLPALPAVFDSADLMDGFQKIKTMLVDDEGPSDVINWHRTSRWLYDLCTHPDVLNCVEDLLGPDIILWGSEFITKEPRSPKTVPWHQDAYYWPLSPHNSVTIWLAFSDVDEANGAMKVIPGTHQGGIIKHKIANESSILSFELEDGAYSEADAVTLEIPGGGFTIHDDAIIHGSAANVSDRWRIGFVIRYSSIDVKCDLSRNPDFLAYLVRGSDSYKHNPMGTAPTEPFARPAYKRRIRKTSESSN